MRGVNVSCTPQNSTAFFPSSMEELLSSDSSAASSSSTVGGRAIDRHNPIITDEKRRGVICKSAPTTPNLHPTKTPIISPIKILHAPKKKTKKIPLRNNHKSTNDVDEERPRKSLSKPSDLMMKSGCTIARPGVDYISPPESSRYLLDDTSFLEMLTDFDPVMKLVPYDTKTAKASKASKPSSSSSSSGSSEQVVILSVSLHCRGCERKMKKHLSRMAGVKSFNIDFTAKKVTVVGDVTPLGVLASISKVKNAQLWSPASSSSFPINSRNMEAWK